MKAPDTEARIGGDDDEATPSCFLPHLSSRLNAAPIGDGGSPPRIN